MSCLICLTNQTNLLSISSEGTFEKEQIGDKIKLHLPFLEVEKG